MTRTRWADLIGLVSRLALGGVLLTAGLLKVDDPTGSIQSVMAYRLVDYQIAEMIGLMLPVVEIALGLLLILGLLTRWTALAGALLMLVFIAGIASAWARGLAIDCGCFGTGGPVAPSETAYLSEILRDTALLAAGAWLVVRPRSLLALDTLIFPSPTTDRVNPDQLTTTEPVAPPALPPEGTAAADPAPRHTSLPTSKGAP